MTGDPDGYFDREDFRYVFDFRTSATTFALGTAVSMLSEEIFREIDAAIRDYNRSHTLERSEERRAEVFEKYVRGLFAIK